METRPRRKYIERINNDNIKIDFWVRGNNELVVDYYNKLNPEDGCFYAFSQSRNDWVEAIRLFNALKEGRVSWEDN